MTTHITPEEAQEYARERLETHVAAIVQNLSLQHEDSPVHAVEKYHNGLRVPVYLADLTIYVYCLPWARGWSIFATPLDKDVASFSWRTVTLKWRGYQMPVYNPRDTIGAWHCPVEQISAAFEYTVRRVKNIDKRRRAALRARGWTY